MDARWAIAERDFANADYRDSINAPVSSVSPLLYLRNTGAIAKLYVYLLKFCFQKSILFYKWEYLDARLPIILSDYSYSCECL